MKSFRLIFFFLVSVFVVTGALSLLMSTSQKIERTITINAPAAAVYEELSHLENFHRFSVWSQQDSTARYTLQGTDGTVGASSSWSGDPAISGKGKIEITALEKNRSVAYQLEFDQPRKGRAGSLFTINEQAGISTVTWQFSLATPRPKNIFNLFFSLDKMMGKDFEDGLAALKKALELKQGTTPAADIPVKSMDFPATTFLAIRQKINWKDIGAFYAQHLPLVYQAALKAQASPGTPCGLYFSWDETNQLTDLAAAVPVKAGTRIQNALQYTENIPASKAVFVDHYGSYDGLPAVYNQVRDYLRSNDLKQKFPIIEQYITDPAKEKDTAKWLTKVVFLLEQ